MEQIPVRLRHSDFCQALGQRREVVEDAQCV